MSRMPGSTLPANLTAIAAKHRQQAEKFRAQHGIEARHWYRITNSSADEAEVMLYDEIGGWLGATADQFIEDLKAISAPRMRIRVNSPGGSVFEGIAIANAVRSHPAKVTVQVDGIAASIASVIAMSGDRVEMAPNTMMMIHDASALCMGDAADMEEMAELLDLISDNVADAYSARAGGTRDQWRARMRAETWYLPEDAVEAGLADEALKAPKTGIPTAEPDEDEPEPVPDMQRQFNFAAYGYHGPRTPEAPKPGPPPSEPEQTATLTIPIGAALGVQLVEVLRASVAQAAEPEAPAVEDADDMAADEARTGTVPTNDWAALTAHLTDDADGWSALVFHLTEPAASSSAATDA